MTKESYIILKSYYLMYIIIKNYDKIQTYSIINYVTNRNKFEKRKKNLKKKILKNMKCPVRQFWYSSVIFPKN